MDGLEHFFYSDFHLNDSGSFVDQFSCCWTNDVNPKNFTVFLVCNDFNKALSSI